MANIYKNAKVDLTTTDLTVLYSVPSNSRAIVKSILVTEVYPLIRNIYSFYTVLNKTSN